MQKLYKLPWVNGPMPGYSQINVNNPIEDGDKFVLTWYRYNTSTDGLTEATGYDTVAVSNYITVTKINNPNNFKKTLLFEAVSAGTANTFYFYNETYGYLNYEGSGTKVSWSSTPITSLRIVYTENSFEPIINSVSIDRKLGYYEMYSRFAFYSGSSLQKCQGYKIERREKPNEFIPIEVNYSNDVFRNVIVANNEFVLTKSADRYSTLMWEAFEVEEVGNYGYRLKSVQVNSPNDLKTTAIIKAIKVTGTNTFYLYIKDYGYITSNTTSFYEGFFDFSQTTADAMPFIIEGSNLNLNIHNVAETRFLREFSGSTGLTYGLTTTSPTAQQQVHAWKLVENTFKWHTIWTGNKAVRTISSYGEAFNFLNKGSKMKLRFTFTTSLTNSDGPLTIRAKQGQQGTAQLLINTTTKNTDYTIIYETPDYFDAHGNVGSYNNDYPIISLNIPDTESVFGDEVTLQYNSSSSMLHLWAFNLWQYTEGQYSTWKLTKIEQYY